MKKTTLIGISILSVFILCSLSYQPMVADEQMESIPIVDDIKTSDVYRYSLREIYNTIFKSDYDCECSGTLIINDRSYPIICYTLMIIITIFFLTPMYILQIIYAIFFKLGIDVFDFLNKIFESIWFVISGFAPFLLFFNCEEYIPDSYY